MSEMVERVEKAIRKILHGGGTIDSAAIAAIEAMREPTEAMKNRFDAGEDRKFATYCWDAFIDQALK